MKQQVLPITVWAILGVFVTNCEPVTDSGSPSGTSTRDLSKSNLELGAPHEIWISNQGEGVNTIQILDSGLNPIDEIEATGDSPHMGDFTDDGRFFYSANVGVEGPGNNVDKIDTQSKKIVEIISMPEGETGSIHATVVRPGSREVWLNNLADKFYVLDRNPAGEEIVDEVAMEVGDTPVCMAFTADGKKMYVANTGSGSFALVDPDRRENLGIIPGGKTGGDPCGLMLDQSRQRMLATVGGESGESKVGYIDVRTDEFVDKSGDLDLHDPHAIIETPDGKKILVGNRGADEILILDSETFALQENIDLGHPVDLIDLDPNGRHAYAALRFFGVARIDLTTLEVTTKELGGDPHGLLVRPAGARHGVGAHRAEGK